MMVINYTGVRAEERVLQHDCGRREDVHSSGDTGTRNLALAGIQAPETWL